MPLVCSNSFKTRSLDVSLLDFKMDFSTLIPTDSTNLTMEIQTYQDTSVFVLCKGYNTTTLSYTSYLFKFAYDNGVLTPVWGVEILKSSSLTTCLFARLSINPVTGNLFLHASGTANSISVANVVEFSGSNGMFLSAVTGVAYVNKPSNIAFDDTGAAYFGFSSNNGNASAAFLYKWYNGAIVWNKQIGSSNGLIYLWPFIVELQFKFGYLRILGGCSANTSSNFVWVVDTNGTLIRQFHVGEPTVTTTTSYYGSAMVWLSDTRFIISDSELVIYNDSAVGSQATISSGKTLGFYNKDLETLGSHYYVLGNPSANVGVGPFKPFIAKFLIGTTTCIEMFSIMQDSSLIHTQAFTLIGNKAIVVGNSSITACFMCVVDLAATAAPASSSDGVFSTTVNSTPTLWPLKTNTRYSQGPIITGSGIWNHPTPAYSCTTAAKAIVLVNPTLPSSSINWWDWTGSDYTVDSGAGSDASYYTDSVVPAAINWWGWTGPDYLIDTTIPTSVLYKASNSLPADINWWSWAGQDYLVDATYASSVSYGPLTNIRADIEWWNWVGNDFTSTVPTNNTTYQLQ